MNKWSFYFTSVYNEWWHRITPTKCCTKGKSPTELTMTMMKSFGAV